MNPQIANLYYLLKTSAKASDIQLIKRLISDNFELLCHAKKHSTSFLHELIESDNYEIIGTIFDTFDENFEKPNLSPSCKAMETEVRRKFFDQENAKGDTPLILAARYGKAEFLVKFLKNHADVNHANRNHSTALLEAIEEESLEMTRILLTYDADLHIENAYKLSPLELAFQKENIALYSMLFYGQTTRENTESATFSAESTKDLDFALSLSQLVKKGNKDILINNLNEIVAQSENHTVKIHPFVLQSAQDYPDIFRLLNKYKSGLHENNIKSEEYSFSADEAPDSHGCPAASDPSREPGEGIRIVGTPQDMDPAPAAGLC
ncbi:ankyrin repeat domain-containing protein [Acidovorax sp. CCYZU-2555]|uniref:ankyrin repeat domain-containing protein n=1 Tax=Acidovorax sp. CCYZU-2555 TaxID=2835042 RepID=UPI001BCDF68A|nr:ankyrin repeat domain-containing protein [Acidovorax sp. CCYZU-2555]MBS7779125.1 ankyrin repeat domain-containing protein [Acidovorax sp. CCYZU-2555]